MPNPLKIFLLSAVLFAALPLPGIAADYGNTRSVSSSNVGAIPAKKPETYGSAITTKLVGGLANVFASPLEIHKNIVNTTNQASLALGVTGGVLKGFLHMTGRMMAGVVDVVSFPLPTESLTTPRYVWENYDVDTRYNSLLKLKATQ